MTFITSYTKEITDVLRTIMVTRDSLLFLLQIRFSLKSNIRPRKIYTVQFTLYLKGNTHWPLGVEQGVRLRLSLEHELVSQSPHLQ